MTAATGRPRTHTWEVLFTLLAVQAIHDDRRVLLSNAQRVSEVLAPDQSRELGLAGPVTYRQVEAAVADLAAGFHERVNHATGEVLPPRIPMRIDTFLTRLVSEALPRALRRGQTVAIDSTDVESHFKRRSWTPGATADAVDGALPETEVEMPTRRVNYPGYPRRGPSGRWSHCYDPAVTEGYRSGKNLRPKEVFLGFDVHLATPVPELGAPGFAPFILGAVVRPAGDGKGDAGIALLDAMADSGLPTSNVISDRGYTYLRAESWADRLMDRDIEQILDLHATQRAVRPGPKPGTIWADGSLYADALPTRLRKLPGFGPRTSSAAKAELIALYDEREAYAFKPMGPPDRGRRTQRVRGPARDGRLRCPNYPQSMRLSPATRPTTSCAPGGCSCGATPTLGPSDMTRERQATRFGTTAWAQSYGRRSAVESLNASLKVHHGSIGRGSTQVMGTTRTTLLLAFMLAAVNIRILLSSYTFDPGRPHPDDVDVQPVLTPSRASHRTRRPFRHRTSRSPAQPNGPPGEHTDWQHPNTSTAAKD